MENDGTSFLFLDRCQDGPVRTLSVRQEKKDTIINFVQKERLDQLSETGAHHGRDRAGGCI